MKYTAEADGDDVTAMYLIKTLTWFIIVLNHWSKSRHVDMSP